MQINPIMQPSDIYLVSKYSNLNHHASSAELNDTISKVNLSNVEIGRSNPNLESNSKYKSDMLNSIVQLSNQQFSNTMHAVYKQSLEEIKNTASYVSGYANGYNDFSYGIGYSSSFYA